MRPYGGALFDGQTPGTGPSCLSCHCLLIETEDGLVLVDTGVVSDDPAADRIRHSAFFRAIDRLDLDPAQSAAARMRALGLDPRDVRHVVMTHLDFDHAAGLPDFPNAAVHVSAREDRHAQHPRGPIARARFRPAQWTGVRQWRTYAGFPDTWFGMPSCRIGGVGADIRLVPLPGHTHGHCGVAVQTEAGWLLHAGDAIFHHRELYDGAPRMPTLARSYQWFMEESQTHRRRSLHRLRGLAARHGTEVEIICTHDPSLLPPEQLPGDAILP